MDERGNSPLPAPWCLARQVIADMWHVPPFVVDMPELEDEVGMQMEMLEIEAQYRRKPRTA